MGRGVRASPEPVPAEIEDVHLRTNAMILQLAEELDAVEGVDNCVIGGVHEEGGRRIARRDPSWA